MVERGLVVKAWSRLKRHPSRPGQRKGCPGDTHTYGLEIRMHVDERAARFTHVRTRDVGGNEIAAIIDVVDVDAHTPGRRLVTHQRIDDGIGRDRVDVGEVAVALA